MFRISAICESLSSVRVFVGELTSAPLMSTGVTWEVLKVLSEPQIQAILQKLTAGRSVEVTASREHGPNTD